MSNTESGFVRRDPATEGLGDHPVERAPPLREPSRLLKKGLAVGFLV